LGRKDGGKQIKDMFVYIYLERRSRARPLVGLEPKAANF
jgi:hypothetical protein